jgi:hypothetical protein
MGKSKTKFQQSWLDKCDGNGHEVRQWCRPKESDPYVALCTVCNKTFNVDAQGFPSITSHSKSSKHREAAMAAFGDQQVRFVTPKAELSATKNSNTTSHKTIDIRSMTCHADKVTKAEILFILKACTAGYAYHSFREVGDLFKMMFPDSAVARDVTLEPTKFSYVISDGLGPYFHNILVDDIKKSASFFTVEVDGTSNVAVRHQLDMHIRFWSEKEGRVITAYYYSKMLGHATAEIMSREILNRLETDGIPIKKLLMLSCDGPSVNKLLHKMLNARVQQEKSSLVSFGSCAIHVMHHAFRKGINALGWSLDEFAVDIFYWFKHSPVRKEEFAKLQQQLKTEEHHFMRYVEVRWLTFTPVLQRLLEQWEPMKEYFLKELPRSDKYVLKNVTL